ncbi:RagB/SusD family nutrient uptake outer membrane protein [Fulvivirgaceae bacterium BMA10]|uniref:RagB/SusD family nutrient uptake outer membrane protein n=1 Tax=Splendidivirga corallicola TaxID=3051826 RepID=A0ABT8KIZ1_9BACT|nr:RagB/SusD family nutrient uptake outer membrane protein [Fulvivirgaceae bacterium BMA10]
MKIYRSLFVLLIIALFSGCDDFLDVVPQDRIDASTFYSTDNEMVIGVNGVYAAQRLMITRGDGGSPLLFTLLESRSDNAGMDHTDQAERVETDLFNEGPGNLPISGAWEALWNIVNLANNVIASGPDAVGDKALIDRVAGEAKFLRALTYFHLVNIWGGVPLRTEPTRDFDNTILPRSDVSEVYNLIVQDLTEAATILPDEYAGGNTNEIGRATSGAALTLLGKVELQRGNASAAVAALRQVEGRYSLLPNFADIHAAGNDNSDEAIFEVNFNPSNQTGWGGNNAFIPASVAAEKGIVAGGSNRVILSAYPTQDLVDSYDPSDLRITGTFGITTEGTYIGPYISKYIDPTAAGQGSDINLVLLRYADVLLMLAEALGEGSEAYGFINQVRARAGLPDIGPGDPGTFMEKVMNERRWELAFEFHRWIDLQRLSDTDVISIMETQIESQQLNKFGMAVDISLTSDDLLFPIPQGEIDISGNVVIQNPGY